MALPRGDMEWPPENRRDYIAEVNDAALRWRGHYYSDVETRKRTLPIAADLAQTSADILFGEGVEVRAEDESGQSAVDELLVSAGIHNKLLEAAEVAAALGGVYLRPVWDEDRKILTVVQPHFVIPTFRWGRLRSCIIWRQEVEDDGTVWRHLEEHTSTGIEHGLYRGTDSQLGARVELGRHVMTEGLRENVRTPDLVVAYVPNVLPNRWHPQSPEGRHDWQAAEELLDDINGVYSSWMRDIRIAKSRILVPEEFLDIADGQLYFDHDREAFVPMNMTGQDKREIVAQQFAIRVDEHERSLMNLMERLISHAGLSPQSFGIRIEGRAESGTALRVREGATFRTIAKKQRYFAPGVKHVLELMLSSRNGGSAIIRERDGMELNIGFTDIAVDDPLETAKTVQLLDTAKAVSLETKVRLAQGLEGEALQQEVDRINEEREAAMPDFGASPGFNDQEDEE